MAITSAQKHIAVLVAKRNGDPDYMIHMSEDSDFAAQEVVANIMSIKDDLEKEKIRHEEHLDSLNSRIEKINSLLSNIEEILNA